MQVKLSEGSLVKYSQVPGRVSFLIKENMATSAGSYGVFREDDSIHVRRQNWTASSSRGKKLRGWWKLEKWKKLITVFSRSFCEISLPLYYQVAFFGAFKFSEMKKLWRKPTLAQRTTRDPPSQTSRIFSLHGTTSAGGFFSSLPCLSIVFYSTRPFFIFFCTYFHISPSPARKDVTQFHGSKLTHIIQLLPE